MQLPLLSKKQGSGAAESSAKAELSVLAELLGGRDVGSPSKADGKSSGFRINLVESRGSAFAKSETDSKGSGYDEGGLDLDGDDAFVISIDIDASVGAKTVESYMRDLDLKDDAKPERKVTGHDDDDDLLALMDSAK